MQFFKHFLHFLYSLSKVIFYSMRKHEVSPLKIDFSREVILTSKLQRIIFGKLRDFNIFDREKGQSIFSLL